MPRLAILFGLLLVGVGVIGYLPTRQPTSLIPAVLGLLGFLAATGRLIGGIVGDRTPSTAAITSLALMAGLCGLFVILCVGSFVSARKRRAEDVAGFQTLPPR